MLPITGTDLTVEITLGVLFLQIQSSISLQVITISFNIEYNTWMTPTAEQ